MFRKLLPALVIVFALAVAGCSAPAATGPESTAVPAVTAAPAAAPPTSAPAATDAPAAAAPSASPLASPMSADPLTPTVSAGTATTTTAATTTMTATAPAASAAAGEAIRLTFAPDTEAGYKVREQLAGRDFPNDAIGVTKDVTGTLVILPDGTLPAGQSKITVNLSTLKSDESRRDNFIKRNTLQTDQYPTAEFVPTAVEGLPTPLPTSGDVTFKLTGDMTIHGVTKSATWDVTGAVANNELKGTATTVFTFADYGMTQPKVMVVLSVADNIELNVNFRMVKAE